MSSDDLDLLARVGARIASLGLTAHRDLARRLYADLAAGRPPRKGGWTMALVIQWARLLRIPPHEKDYPVRTRADGCGCSNPRPYTTSVFPGGAAIRCENCNLVWLLLE